MGAHRAPVSPSRPLRRRWIFRILALALPFVAALGLWVSPTTPAAIYDPFPVAAPVLPREDLAYEKAMAREARVAQETAHASSEPSETPQAPQTPAPSLEAPQEATVTPESPSPSPTPEPTPEVVEPEPTPEPTRPAPPPPPAQGPEPEPVSEAPGGAYQEYAAGKVGATQFACLEKLWGRESGWNPNAQNPTSTAYGIPQFLNSTWASTGISKTSDPYLQIDAGLIYIQARYGTPCAAWEHSQAKGWY